MTVSVTVTGVEPGLLMHSGEGALNKASPLNQEKALITSKRKKTEADEARLLEIETKQSIWVTPAGLPTVPPHVFRSAIWQASKLERRGMDVNRTLRMMPGVRFQIAPELEGLSVDELAGRVQHLANVRVQSSRVVRARSLFMPWSAKFGVVIAPETVSLDDLRRWVEICGQRIGVGDWRPDKGGVHGMFDLSDFVVDDVE